MNRRAFSLHRLATCALIVWVGSSATVHVHAQQEDAVPAFKQLDSMEARVQGCVTCHGQSGQGTNNGYFPRIAGKPAGYLYNQLVAFRDGTRRYPPMNYLVAYLPDSYLQEIAEHFSKQRPAFAAREQASVDQASLQHGQTLVQSGDPRKGVPACVACHGLESQWVRFAQSRRENVAPCCALLRGAARSKLGDETPWVTSLSTGNRCNMGCRHHTANGF